MAHVASTKRFRAPQCGGTRARPNEPNLSRTGTRKGGEVAATWSRLPARVSPPAAPAGRTPGWRSFCSAELVRRWCSGPPGASSRPRWGPGPSSWFVLCPEPRRVSSPAAPCLFWCDVYGAFRKQERHSGTTRSRSSGRPLVSGGGTAVTSENVSLHRFTHRLLHESMAESRPHPSAVTQLLFQFLQLLATAVSQNHIRLTQHFVYHFNKGKYVNIITFFLFHF